MKFIAFLAFIATASVSANSAITTIYPSSNSNCEPLDIPPISECGPTDLLSYNITEAKIDFEGQNVTWFEQEGCQVAKLQAIKSHGDCFPLIFTLRCVKIHCQV